MKIDNNIAQVNFNLKIIENNKKKIAKAFIKLSDLKNT